jgi:hypothetical protein
MKFKTGDLVRPKENPKDHLGWGEANYNEHLKRGYLRRVFRVTHVDQVLGRVHTKAVDSEFDNCFFMPYQIDLNKVPKAKPLPLILVNNGGIKYAI